LADCDEKREIGQVKKDVSDFLDALTDQELTQALGSLNAQELNALDKLVSDDGLTENESDKSKRNSEDGDDYNQEQEQNVKENEKRDELDETSELDRQLEAKINFLIEKAKRSQKDKRSVPNPYLSKLKDDEDLITQLEDSFPNTANIFQSADEPLVRVKKGHP
jgi:hypothetical protein